MGNFMLKGYYFQDFQPFKYTELASFIHLHFNNYTYPRWLYFDALKRYDKTIAILLKRKRFTSWKLAMLYGSPISTGKFDK